MNNHALKNTIRPVLAATTLAFFAACNATTPMPQTPPAYIGGESHFDQVKTVQISASDSPEQIASSTGGTIIAWHPEDGYAMVGLTGKLGLLATNSNAYKMPEKLSATSVGLAAWKEGSTSWGSGWNVWGSGWTVWGSGGSSHLPGKNALIWQKIRLPQAALLAPKAGNGIKVAIIDSGIDLSHPAFTGALVAASDMWDFVDGDAVPQEVFSSTGSNEGYGHGTAVAGIVVQIAPKAKLMPIRVLNSSGEGDTANVVAAIDFAVKHGAKIINLSLGTDYDASLGAMIATANNAGVIIVAASGNSNNENITYPGNQGKANDMLYGVGSSNLNDLKSSFSTYGSTLEMTAIGEGISTPAPGNKMGVWNGTSMAAPMVSAALALARGEFGTTNPASLSGNMFVATTRIDTNSSYVYKLGSGRLDLERFIQFAR